MSKKNKKIWRLTDDDPHDPATLPRGPPPPLGWPVCRTTILDYKLKLFENLKFHSLVDNL